MLNSKLIFPFSQSEVDETTVPLDYYTAPPVQLGYPNPTLVARAAELLAGADRPLVIVGKGAAYGRAEDAVNKLIKTTKLPFLPTPMGNYFCF